MPDFSALGVVTTDSGTTVLPSETLSDARNLTVSVVHDNGTAVSNATVRFSQEFSDDGTDVWAGEERRTGQDGIARIEVNGTVATEISVYGPSGSDLGSYHTQIVADDNNNISVVLKEQVLLNGTVAASNGASVANSSIHIHGINGTEGGSSEVLDANGTFELGGNVNGTYEVFFQQRSWESSAAYPNDGVADLAPFQVVETSTNDIDLGQLTVPEGHLVNVTVVGPDGQPVESADITVEAKANGSFAESGETATTNAQGELVLETATSPGVEAPNGTLGVYVDPTNASLASQYQEITVSGNDSVTISLGSVMQVSGTLESANGDPLATDNVRLHGIDVDDGEHTWTDSNGTFAAEVSNGTYAFHFVQTDTEGSDAPTFPADGVPDFYTFGSVNESTATVGTEQLPQAHNLTVEVVDAAGSPLAGVPLHFGHGDTDRRVHASAETGTDGTMTVEAVGSVGVHAEPSTDRGYTDNGTELTVDSNRTVTLVLHEVANVTGSVTGPDGTPLNGKEVMLRGAGGAGNITTDTGTFTLGVKQNESYDLGIEDYHWNDSVPDFERNGIVDVYAMDRVSVGTADEDVGSYQLPDAHAVNITVVDTSGNAVSDVPVFIEHVNGNATVSSDGYTNANGVFVWEGAEQPGAELNGTVRVHVEPEHSTLSDNHTEFTVTANDSFEVVVEQQQEVTGRVVTPDGTPISDAEVVVRTGDGFEFASPDTNGDFSIALPANGTYSLGLLEAPTENFDDAGVKNGVADIAKLGEVNTSETTALGNLSAPIGHETTIQAVDRYGNPVPDAGVIIRGVDPQNAESGFDWFGQADADGYVYNGENASNGYELNGTVTFEPHAPDNYTAVTENTTVTIDGQQTLTFVFERQGEVVSVNGSITTADGSPIEGRIFSDNAPEWKGHSAEIQSDGSFSVPVETNEPFGIGYVQFTDDGIGVRDGIADVYPFTTVNTTGDTSIGSFTAPDGHVLNVTVVDQNGTPVEGASVMYEPLGNQAFNPITVPATTNANGKAVVDGMTGLEVTGDVTVYATRLGQHYNGTNVTVTGPSEVTLTIPDPQHVNVSGRVLTPAGNPVVNDTLAVYAGDLFGEPLSGKTVTNTNGEFSTTAAKNVTQDLEYYQGNLDDRNVGNQTYFPTDDTPDVFAAGLLDGSGDVAIGNVTLPQAYHVDVKVVTPNGTPVEGATVDFTHYSSSSDADAGYTGVETNANGLYEIPASDGTGIDLVGDVWFSVEGPNGAWTSERVTINQSQTVTIELAVDEETVPLALSANATTVAAGDDVRFTVTDDANDPVNETTLTITLPDGSTQTLETDATGTAVLSTGATGDYAVTASKPDTAATTYQSDSLSITAKEPGRVVVDAVDVPAEVVRGDDVTADITLSNPGAFEATDSLTVSGTVDVSNDSITLAPGETRTVVRTISTAGTTTDTFTVSATTEPGTVTNTSTVLEPANISVQNYTLEQTTILGNEPVNATATLQNTGEVEGTYVLNLSVDGSIVTNESVTVGPTATTTVNIATLVAWDSYGAHNATVANETATNITVLRPTNPDASVNITAPSDGQVSDSGSLTLTYDLSNVSEGVDYVEYRVDNGSYQTITDGLTTTSEPLSAGDGEHTVSVRLVDNLGNAIAISERTFGVDTVAPTVGVAAARTDAISVNDSVSVRAESSDANPGTTTFKVTNASGVVFQQDVSDEVADGNTTLSWDGSNQNGVALASGQYTLEVTSTDAAGNTNTTTQTVTVDNDAPAVDATGVTDGSETTTVYVNSNDSITITGTASDAAQSGVSTVEAVVRSDSTAFEQRVNATLNGDGTWTATLDVSTLPDDGTYAVGARATDNASNVGTALNESLTVVVDREMPSVGAAIMKVDSNNGTVNITASEVLPAAPNVTVITPNGNHRSVSLTKTGDTWNGTFQYDGDGEYHIVANATDRAGNNGSATATARVQTDIQTVDKTAFITNNQTGTFLELHTKNDVSKAFGALTESNAPLAALSNKLSGSQFIEGELGDRLDENLTYALIGIPVNESQLPAGVSPEDVDIRRFNETTNDWEVVGETTVKTLNVTGTPTEYYVVNVSHFSTYGAVAPDSTAPSIDGSSLSGSGTPYNYDTSTVDVTFDYSDAESGIDTSNVTVSLDGQEVTGSYAGDLQVTSSSTTLTAVDLVGSGSHTVELTVTDQAGNEQTTTKTFSVAEDTTAPSLSTTFTDGQSFAYGTESVTFDLSYSDTQSGVDTSAVSVTFDGTDVTAPATVTSSGVEYTATDLAAGTYTIAVSAPDAEGNVETTTRTFTIEADTTDPSITSVTQTPSADSGTLYPTTTTQVTTSFDYTDTESGVDASAVTVAFDDGSGFVDVTDQAVVTSSQANYTALDLDSGTYTVRTTVVDADGNEQVSERSFTIGTGTAPQITGTSLTPALSGSTLPAGTSQATITVSYDDAEGDVDASAITATFDGTDVTSSLSVDKSAGTVSYQATGLTNSSSHTLAVDVVDSASNTDSTTVSFDVGSESDDSSVGSSSPSSSSSDDGTVDSSSTLSNQSAATVTSGQTADDPTDNGPQEVNASNQSAVASTPGPNMTTTETTSEPGTDAPQTTDTSAPGFGLTTVLGALVLVLVLARRRL